MTSQRHPESAIASAKPADTSQDSKTKTSLEIKRPREQFGQPYSRAKDQSESSLLARTSAPACCRTRASFSALRRRAIGGHWEAGQTVVRIATAKRPAVGFQNPPTTMIIAVKVKRTRQELTARTTRASGSKPRRRPPIAIDGPKIKKSKTNAGRAGDCRLAAATPIVTTPKTRTPPSSHHQPSLPHLQHKLYRATLCNRSGLTSQFIPVGSVPIGVLAVPTSRTQ